MAEKKQIRVTKAQRDELHSRKSPNETYADVVARLLEDEDEQSEQTTDSAMTTS